jgi:hypothetical protein
MSIFSDLLHGKITFSQAISETTVWAGHLPGAGQAGTNVVGDLKQAASDAVSFADSAAGTIIGDGVVALELAAAAMFAKLGPIGSALTPLADAGIDQAAGILAATIHAEAAKAKAALAPAPQATASGA